MRRDWHFCDTRPWLTSVTRPGHVPQAAGELLVAEVTICPDRALGRFYARKQRRYAPLLRSAPQPPSSTATSSTTTASSSSSPPPPPSSPSAPAALRPLPPLIVAVGAGSATQHHPLSAQRLLTLFTVCRRERRAFPPERRRTLRRPALTRRSDATVCRRGCRHRARAASHEPKAAASRGGDAQLEPRDDTETAALWPLREFPATQSRETRGSPAL